MVVLNDQSQPGWVVGASNSNYLKVKAVQPTPLPKGQVCQLWMQTPDQRMISLGTLPHSGHEVFRSPIDIMPDATYQVSIESKDSMPSDKPSGEIVFEGELVSF